MKKGYDFSKRKKVDAQIIVNDILRRNKELVQSLR